MTCTYPEEFTEARKVIKKNAKIVVKNSVLSMPLPGQVFSGADQFYGNIFGPAGPIFLGPNISVTSG